MRVQALSIAWWLPDWRQRAHTCGKSAYCTSVHSPNVKRRPDCGVGIVWTAFVVTEPFFVPFDVAALV